MTLKELLKPPFKVDTDGYIFDSRGFVILSTTLPEAIDWIAQALNEKTERDFGEPKRWILLGKAFYDTNRNIYECPDCEQRQYSTYRFCPHCGARLKPPEDNQ